MAPDDPVLFCASKITLREGRAVYATSYPGSDAQPPAGDPRVIKNLSPGKVLDADREIEIFWTSAAQSGNPLVIDLSAFEAQENRPYYVDSHTPERTFRTVTLRYINDNNGLDNYTVAFPAAPKDVKVTRYHFDNWPDGDQITMDELNCLVWMVRSWRGAVWIHCQSGVGRTGSLIAATIIADKIDRNEFDPVKFKDEIKNVIQQLRDERGPDALRSPTQVGMLTDYARVLLALSRRELQDVRDHPDHLSQYQNRIISVFNG